MEYFEDDINKELIQSNDEEQRRTQTKLPLRIAIPAMDMSEEPDQPKTSKFGMGKSQSDVLVFSQDVFRGMSGAKKNSMKKVDF